MIETLNITNGDSAADLMREGGVEGDILPWRDVLHDGPVPGGLSLSELSDVRAEFIASRGWGDRKAIRRAFADRDRALRKAGQYSLLRLWFEHDLYDQLQLIQILHWLFEHPLPSTRLELICTEDYLGEQTPESIANLIEQTEEITPQQLALGNAAWEVFGYPSPDEFAELAFIDTSALPFLHDTVVRLIEEFPDEHTGLAKTEYRTIKQLRRFSMTPMQLFTANQKEEKRVYLGDWSYWCILNDLLAEPNPLIGFEEGEGPVSADNFEQVLTLTAKGRAVLDGECSRVEFGFPERWIGGVRWSVEDWWNNRWFPQRLLGRG